MCGNVAANPQTRAHERTQPGTAPGILVANIENLGAREMVINPSNKRRLTVNLRLV